MDTSLRLPLPPAKADQITPENIPETESEPEPEPESEPESESKSETFMETVSETVPETIPLDAVAELAVQLLSNTDTSIKLTSDQLHILQVLLANSPSSLTDFKNCLDLIIIDGKIDASDIPLFMKIIRDVYMICHENKVIKVSTLAITFAPILKYIICILLKKNDLATPNLVDCCNNIIDTSVQMIQLQSNLKPKKWAFKLC